MQGAHIIRSRNVEWLYQIPRSRSVLLDPYIKKRASHSPVSGCIVLGTHAHHAQSRMSDSRHASQHGPHASRVTLSCCPHYYDPACV